MPKSKTVADAAPKRPFWTLKRKESMNGYVFILPWLIGFVVIFAYSIINSIQLSLSEFTNYSNYEMKFIGFKNYTEALTSDPTFLTNYWNNIKMLLETVPFVIVFSLLIAVMLNRKFKGRTLFRAIFFLPVILGAGYVMNSLMYQSSGTIDSGAMQTAKEVLLPREVAIYIGAEATAAASSFLDLISTILWKSGVPIILFLAALQGVPSSLYEAARVDSASEWEMFWLITLPMITPMMLLNMVYTVIDSFNDSQNWLLRYIQTQTFNKSRFEYGAAMAWLFFIWIIVIIGIIFLVMRPFVNRVKDN